MTSVEPRRRCARCRCYLSAYNGSLLCSPCSRDWMPSTGRDGTLTVSRRKTMKGEDFARIRAEVRDRFAYNPVELTNGIGELTLCGIALAAEIKIEKQLLELDRAEDLRSILRRPSEWERFEDEEEG